jgi:hypothetical protein
VGAELFRADRQTDKQRDMTKLIVAFRYFPNALESLGFHQNPEINSSAVRQNLVIALANQLRLVHLLNDIIQLKLLYLVHSIRNRQGCTPLRYMGSEGMNLLFYWLLKPTCGF